MLIPDFSKLRGSNASEKGISKNYPEFYQYIMDNFPVDLTFSEKIYWYKHNIISYPICKNCGSRVKYAGPTRGYYQYCSLKCSNNDNEVKKKKENSILDKFESIAASYDSRMQKTKQTLIDKYGSVKASYDSRMQKTKQTCLDRYGVEYSFQSERIREKAKQTNLEKYGVENPTQSDYIKEKTKQTCLDRYGVEYSFQSEELKEKAKQTCLDRYGVEYAMQNSDILSKAMLSKKRNIINGHGDILDVSFKDNQTIYTCSCPHSNCNKCEKKVYSCNSVCYYNRRYKNLEVCTNLLPQQQSHSKRTSLELFITNILDEYNIEYETNVNNIISPLELDIYVPSKQIAIECNGLYWHSTFNKSNNYHIGKYKMCEDNNIQLLTFWEDQIIHTSEIIKSILLSKLGVYERKIYARKCIIKEVSSKESVEFLKHNHLQGNINSSIRLGLYYEGELVSIMTFGQHRHLLNNQSSENVYELYRLCNKLNTIVVGGASKLLNYFIKQYQPKQITSFASKDISNGNIYEKLGFEISGNSSSYWFIDSKTLNRYHRYKFRKSELLNLGYENELDFLKSERYLKIFDSGQLKFSLNIK